MCNSGRLATPVRRQIASRSTEGDIRSFEGDSRASEGYRRLIECGSRSVGGDERAMEGVRRTIGGAERFSESDSRINQGDGRAIESDLSEEARSGQSGATIVQSEGDKRSAQGDRKCANTASRRAIEGDSRAIFSSLMQQRVAGVVDHGDFPRVPVKRHPDFAH